jgi:hypothetical protein
MFCPSGGVAERLHAQAVISSVRHLNSFLRNLRGDNQRRTALF